MYIFTQEISNFLTHYSGNPSFVIRSSAPLPVATPSQHSYVGMASTATEHVQGTTPTQRFSKARSSDVLQEEKVAAKVCGCGDVCVWVGVHISRLLIMYNYKEVLFRPVFEAIFDCL